jgi:cytidylate kinase
VSGPVDSQRPLPAIIAIDGPAGAGKSTIGMRLAALLGYRYFDTGVLYRAVTLAGLRRGVALDDEAGLAALAASLDLEFMTPAVDDGRQHTVLLGGEDVTWQLRQPRVNDAVSIVSAHPAVRTALLARQRAVARQGRVVMVGRDVGTVVLPDADLKIFLDASATERARRRHREQVARGEPSDEAAVLAAILRRDQLDTQRATSPLRPAPDAMHIDSDRLGVEEVLAHILVALGISGVPHGA